MRILASKKTLFIAITLCILSSNLTAQKNNTIVYQDPKFDQLLTEKRKINISYPANDQYKIQIFSGDNEKARNTLNQFKQQFKELDATIVFFTPNYKVWIGNFKTRIEAEKNILEIKKSYPNVYLIKPNK